MQWALHSTICELQPAAAAAAAAPAAAPAAGEAAAAAAAGTTAETESSRGIPSGSTARDICSKQTKTKKQTNYNK